MWLVYNDHYRLLFDRGDLNAALRASGQADALNTAHRLWATAEEYAEAVAERSLGVQDG